MQQQERGSFNLESSTRMLHTGSEISHLSCSRSTQRRIWYASAAFSFVVQRQASPTGLTIFVLLSAQDTTTDPFVLGWGDTHVPTLFMSLWYVTVSPFHLVSLPALNFETLPTHTNTDFFTATTLTANLNLYRLFHWLADSSTNRKVTEQPENTEKKLQFESTLKFPSHFRVHIWFPHGILNSHVAASCCVVEWKDCNNTAHDPKPPFLFHHYCAFFFFRSNDSFSLLPVAFWTPFWVSHEYMYVFTRESCMSVCAEGCQPFCMGRLYWLWQESPYGASGPWQSAAGPVLPRAESYRQQNKSNATPSPPVSAGKWQAGTFCPAAIHN